MFYAKEQDRKRALILDAWGPEWTAVGTYMDWPHAAALAWVTQRDQGLAVPAVVTPEIAKQWRAECVLTPPPCELPFVNACNSPWAALQL